MGSISHFGDKQKEIDYRIKKREMENKRTIFYDSLDNTLFTATAGKWKFGFFGLGFDLCERLHIIKFFEFFCLQSKNYEKNYKKLINNLFFFLVCFLIKKK